MRWLGSRLSLSREAGHFWILLRFSTGLPRESHCADYPYLPHLDPFLYLACGDFCLVFLSSSRGSGVSFCGDGSDPDGWDAPPTSPKLIGSLTPRCLGGRNVACQSRDFPDGLRFNKVVTGCPDEGVGLAVDLCRVLAPWSLSVSLSTLRVRSLELLCSVRALAITYGYRLVWVPFA